MISKNKDTKLTKCWNFIKSVVKNSRNSRTIRKGNINSYVQLEEMRDTLDGITKFLDCLDKERSSRSKNIIKEREDVQIRDKSHEGLCKENVHWISKLNESKLRGETKKNSRIAKLEAERNQDRAMLICIVKQIQKVNQIKSSENLKQFPTNEFFFGNITDSNSSEISIQVTNLEKPKKSIRKNLFSKISQKKNFETCPGSQKKMEINFNPTQSSDSRKDIPFYLKLIGRKSERNKIKFMRLIIRLIKKAVFNSMKRFIRQYRNDTYKFIIYRIEKMMWKCKS